MTHAERLNQLFNGLDRAFGLARPTGRKDDRGKTKVRYQTKRARLTETEWEQHLAGEHCLVPIPIRDDGTTGFGAVDIDTYNLDLGALAKKVTDLELPMVVCRSKSGGAHVFLFLEEPLPADEIQDALVEWAVSLGYPGVEIFPKQVSLANELDTGNGIAAPYRGGEDSLEYAVRPDGSAMSVEEFLDYAESLRVRELPEIELPGDDEFLEGAPPCLKQWARNGVVEGQRNDVMFDFGIFCRKKWPDDWKQKFEEVNRRYCTPPLAADEVMTLMKAVGGQKEYLYKAKCEGPYCQPSLCRRATHGRGGGRDDPGVVIEGLTKIETDPALWIVSVNGQRILLDRPRILEDQKAFRLVVMEQSSPPVRPKHIKPALWDRLVDKLWDTMEVEPAPEDAGPVGALRIHLHDYFSQYVTTKRDELIMQRPWHDEENGRVWFRSSDFVAYLKKNRVYTYAERDIWSMVRDLEGGHKQFRAGGRNIRAWWVPFTAEPEQELEVPEIPEKRDEVPF